MTSPESALIRRILARHGSRPDLRLWRNETAGAWVGGVKGRTGNGDIVLKGARMIQAGLCTGSADLVGLTNDGRFVGIEVKTGNQTVTKKQGMWLALINKMGGLGAVVHSVEDVDEILGEPPEGA